MLKKTLIAALCFAIAASVVAADTAKDLTARAVDAYTKRQFAESADLFVQAIAAGANDESMYYNAACASALAGRTDLALDLLSRAVTKGFSNAVQIREDADLQSLHDNPRFNQIAAAAEKASATRERLWNSPAIATPYAQALSLDERIAGLSRIWSEAKFNFIYFDRVPDLDWDAAYVSYLPRVRAAESTAEYYKLLSSFIALLKDGHTGVTPPRELWPQLWAEAPLRVSLIEGRPVVTDVYDGELASLRGMELTAVDGIPVKQYAAERVAPHQPASTPQDLDSRTWRRVLWGAEGTNVDLTFVDAKGRSVQRTVRRLTGDEEKEVIVQPPSFEYRLLPGKIAYVAMNQFGDSKAAEEFEARFDEIAKTSALIIDVRRNGGGNSGNGYRVLSALTDKPFETSRWSTRDYKPAYRAWGRPEERFGEGPDEVPPSGSRLYSKPVVVLTSAQTYSAAEDFVVAFDAMKRGTIIGEPTGGSTGQPLMLKLPGGGFARICTKRDTYPDGKEFVGVGVQPQVVVHPTVSDLRAKKDTVLEAAVSYLKKSVR